MNFIGISDSSHAHSKHRQTTLKHYRFTPPNKMQNISVCHVCNTKGKRLPQYLSYTATVVSAKQCRRSLLFYVFLQCRWHAKICWLEFFWFAIRIPKNGSTERPLVFDYTKQRLWGMFCIPFFRMLPILINVLKNKMIYYIFFILCIFVQHEN